MISITGDSAHKDVKLFAVCASVLYIKFLATTMIQGRKAFAAGSRAPEDNKLPMAKGQPNQSFGALSSASDNTAVKVAVEDEMRWKRIVQNDLESMPMALIVFWGSIVAGGNETVTCVLLALYTTARISHTLTFACQMPLARMGSWVTGITCILGAGINAAIAAIS